MIRFVTFNIRNGQNGGLELALHRMVQVRVDCGFLQEKNLTKVVYTQEFSGFGVMLTEATSNHRGGVAILYRKVDHFAIKELRLHFPNIISFQMVTGRRRWHVLGCYIAPSNAFTIEEVSAAIRDQHYGSELLVAGKFNANLAEPEGTPRGEAIVGELAAVGLLDMCLLFLPRCNPWLYDRCRWSMQRDGQEVRSRTYYILRKYCRMF